MIVVVGAGAAGLMAAVFAARRGAPVLVLERTADGGRKILISGGGRCNVLPARLEPERFVSESSPALVRRLLRSWALPAQRAFFEDDLAIPLTLEADTAKYFPSSNRARDVRDGLVAAVRAAGGRLAFGATVTGVRPVEHGWVVETSAGAHPASQVILASGGLSVPTTGSDGTGLRLVADLGHRVQSTYAALTPLTADPAVHAHLSGVSVTARLRARTPGGSAVDASGGFLITHRGYSGPAVLDVSHVAVRSLASATHASVRVQWTPHPADEWHDRLRRARGYVATEVAAAVPERLAAQLLRETGIPPDRRATELTRDLRVALVEALTNYPLPWTGHEGYKKAEVTGGGVALDEVDPATLESRRHRGLYFCGEMLDAFGPIGGHNFSWAWSTGRLAGRGAAAASNSFR